jgi:hypothetical protein
MNVALRRWSVAANVIGWALPFDYGFFAVTRLFGRVQRKHIDRPR